MFDIACSVVLGGAFGYVLGCAAEKSLSFIVDNVNPKWSPMLCAAVNVLLINVMRPVLYLTASLVDVNADRAFVTAFIVACLVLLRTMLPPSNRKKFQGGKNRYASLARSWTARTRIVLPQPSW